MHGPATKGVQRPLNQRRHTNVGEINGEGSSTPPLTLLCSHPCQKGSTNWALQETV